MLGGIVFLYELEKPTYCHCSAPGKFIQSSLNNLVVNDNSGMCALCAPNTKHSHFACLCDKTSTHHSL